MPKSQIELISAAARRIERKSKGWIPEDKAFDVLAENNYGGNMTEKERTIADIDEVGLMFDYFSKP